jgi:ABC-type sugar transport system substrate-binding protein
LGQGETQLRYVTRNDRRDAQSLERGYQKEMRMLIRSLTLATLLAIAGPLFAADGDSPLDMDKGRARPLIVIAPSTVDPTWVSLKKSLDEPANRKGFTDRNMVLYTVLNLMGQRDGKDLGPQDTAALIRSLKLGAGAKTKVILVGKDGEKKLEQSDAIKLEEIFSAVDQLPAAEKEATATVAAPVAEAEPAVKGTKGTKPGKPAKPAKPPEMPDD